MIEGATNIECVAFIVVKSATNGYTVAYHYGAGIALLMPRR